MRGLLLTAAVLASAALPGRFNELQDLVVSFAEPCQPKNLVSAKTGSFPTRRTVELAKQWDIEHTVKLVNNATAAQVDACPGYNATNVVTTSFGLTADLFLAGPACNVYGPDLVQLKLQVTYEDGGHHIISMLPCYIVELAHRITNSCQNSRQGPEAVPSPRIGPSPPQV